VAQQTSLLAFDRQNHAGASDGHAATLSAAIQQEAEAMLAEKRVVSSAITIQENADKMKARARPNPNRNPSQAGLACAGAAAGPLSAPRVRKGGVLGKSTRGDQKSEAALAADAPATALA
jgi:hypothetical protein